MENLQEKHAEDPTIILFKNYTVCIKARDHARRMAEEAEKERKAAWRVFYKYTEELESLEKELDIVSGIPPAPKKRGRVIDLTGDNN
jgi:hypothetical protein